METMYKVIGLGHVYNNFVGIPMSLTEAEKELAAIKTKIEENYGMEITDSDDRYVLCSSWPHQFYQYAEIVPVCTAKTGSVERILYDMKQALNKALRMNEEFECTLEDNCMEYALGEVKDLITELEGELNKKQCITNT